ncbi:MAG: hypothetical protein J6Y78_10735 [Paludibacteraceae bacterium]|nr:hypothetical protein [Paludibacteraceae bacterium]
MTVKMENGHLVRIEEANPPYKCKIFFDEDGELVVNLRRGAFSRNYRIDELDLDGII